MRFASEAYLQNLRPIHVIAGPSASLCCTWLPQGTVPLHHTRIQCSVSTSQHGLLAHRSHRGCRVTQMWHMYLTVLTPALLGPQALDTKITCKGCRFGR